MADRGGRPLPIPMTAQRWEELKVRIRAVMATPDADVRVISYAFATPEIEIVRGSKRLAVGFEPWSLYRVLVEEFAMEIYTVDNMLSLEVPITLSAIRDAARHAAEKQDGELRRRLEKLVELLDEALALFS